MNQFVIVIDYFGEWPPWMGLFLSSCEMNECFDWLIHTDCEKLDAPPNVKIINISWDEYVEKVSEKLGIDFSPAGPYKINDIKPMLGEIWREEISQYKYYGYSDIDLIYGRLFEFLPKKIKRYSVISTHDWCISGHFSLFKNTARNRLAYKRVSGWRRLVEDKLSRRFDEDIFISAYKDRRSPGVGSIDMLWRIIRRFNLYGFLFDKLYLKEMFTTPLVPGLWRSYGVEHSDRWIYFQGRIVNANDTEDERPYIHFMNYLSARYMDLSYGRAPPWLNADLESQCGRLDASRGFQIGLDGFSSL